MAKRVQNTDGTHVMLKSLAGLHGIFAQKSTMRHRIFWDGYALV